VFKLVPVTLTLAGIAGFILSIGMAVDANVLIFARLKDELRKDKTIGTAVTDGFRNAWPSIRDSNISTMITCAILYWFGSTFGASTLRGFALTLGLGVIVSMFSAVFITRIFLTLILNLPFAQNKNMYGGDVSPHNRKADATA
jgi:preprotein translocase subunit SecD